MQLEQYNKAGLIADLIQRDIQDRSNLFIDQDNSIGRFIGHWLYLGKTVPATNHGREYMHTMSDYFIKHSACDIPIAMYDSKSNRLYVFAYEIKRILPPSFTSRFIDRLLADSRLDTIVYYNSDKIIRPIKNKMIEYRRRT